MSENKVIYKVTLPPEEIVAQKTYNCPIAECREIFHNASHLQLHLSRRHKAIRTIAAAPHPATNGTMQFHCPDGSCLYHHSSNSGRHFPSLRSLKQHYLKMHEAKTFGCNLCDKSFASESYLRHHRSLCGQVFACVYCSATYGARESLLTHARRKGHGFEALLAMKKVTQRKEKGTKKRSLQTEPSLAVATQTSVLKTHQSTQTDAANVPVVHNSSQTLVDDVEQPQDVGCGLSATLLPTAVPIINSVCTETQTDDLFHAMFSIEERQDPMLFSHTYTQTCDELFAELGLSTIETQTSWDHQSVAYSEYVVSAETQTNFMNAYDGISTDECTHGTKLPNGDQDAVKLSMHTQTTGSMEFLHEINVDDSCSIHTQTS